MAAKYARQFTLPEGFPQLLKDLTRECLRADPDDIYRFGHEYFSEAIERRNNPEDYGAEPDRMSMEELVDRIGQWFKDADADGNGVLDRSEFKLVFVNLKDELGLNDKDILKIMAEADENEDGQIEYEEFLPIAVDVVSAIYAKQDFENEAHTRADEKEKALLDTKDFLLHGMPRAELEAALDDVFSKADADGNGWLSRKEFVTCIRDADLGFTKKEINVLLSEVDVDGDGKVTYEEFSPLCFTLLVEMVSEALVEVPQKEEELREFFIDLFGTAADDDGKLAHTTAIKLMKEADLGLTRVQIHAIMSEADEDENGMIDYEQLANAMGGMVMSLCSVEFQPQRSAKYQEARASDDYDKVWGFSAEELENQIMQACASVDTAGSGKLAKEDIQMVISEIMPELPPKHLKSVMMPGHADASGLTSYADIARDAFKIIQFMQVQLE